jgi:uncharacterized membrane protein SirB2
MGGLVLRKPKWLVPKFAMLLAAYIIALGALVIHTRKTQEAKQPIVSSLSLMD